PLRRHPLYRRPGRLRRAEPRRRRWRSPRPGRTGVAEHRPRGRGGRRHARRRRQDHHLPQGRPPRPRRDQRPRAALRARPLSGLHAGAGCEPGLAGPVDGGRRRRGAGLKGGFMSSGFRLGKGRGMTPEELHAFLTGTRIFVKVGTVGEDGWPNVNPAWYEYDGECFWLVTKELAGFCANMRRESRVSLSAVIVDAHLHVDDIPALGWNLEAAECVRRMDEAGIERGVVMTIVDAPEVNPRALELVADACAAYPGRLDGFARIHPWYGDESLALLERAFALGFKGLKLHPVSTLAHPAAEDTLRLIRAAAEHGAPTLFHCGDEPLTTPHAVAPAAAA